MPTFHFWYRVDKIPLSHSYRFRWNLILPYLVLTTDSDLHLVTLADQGGYLAFDIRPGLHSIFIVKVLWYPVPAPHILNLLSGKVNPANHYPHHHKK